MQIIFSTFVVFQLFTACVSVRPKEVLGTRIYGSLSRQAVDSDASLEQCTGHTGPLCASDCRTLMICAGRAESIANITCQQFCASGECSSTMPSSCQVDSTFVCTAQGTFPDPYDCTKYHYCTNPGSSSIDYQCPPDYVFTIKSKMCTHQAACEVVNCENSENQYMMYDSVNNGYYVYCGSSPVMFKCADADKYSYNIGLGTCVYNCPQTGYYVDVFDCTQYLSCNYISGNVYTVAKIPCPANYYYNGNECTLGPCTSLLPPSFNCINC